MPDGTPDLQGIWTGGTLTPFERPAQLGTQLPESERAEAAAHGDRKVLGGRPQARRGRPRQRCVHRPGPEDPAERPDLARGRARRWQSAVAAGSGATPRLQPEQFRFVRDDEPVGPLHHARAHDDVSGRLQQRVPDRADAGLRADRRGDDPRRAHHPDGQERRATRRFARALVGRRLTRSLGRLDAGRRDDELQRTRLDRHRPERRAGARRAVQRADADRRAIHARRATTRCSTRSRSTIP